MSAEYHLGVNLTRIEKQRKSKFKYELAIFLSIPLFLQVAPFAIQLATTAVLWPFKPLVQWYYWWKNG